MIQELTKTQQQINKSFNLRLEALEEKLAKLEASEE